LQEKKGINTDKERVIMNMKMISGNSHMSFRQQYKSLSFSHSFIFKTSIKKKKKKNTHRAALQPKDDRPWLGGILNSVGTSVKPPEHVGFCVNMNTPFEKIKREKVEKIYTIKNHWLTGSDFYISPFL
jgi:hypothetical protein